MEDPLGHTPVLPREVSELLAVGPGEVVVDATIGSGGHARLFAEALGAGGTLIGLDVDPQSLATARSALSGASCRVELRHANFSEIEEALSAIGVEAVDVILADLGVRSAQLDDPDRGLSFLHDGPLDMRLDPRLTTTAADLVNRLRQQALGDLLYFNAQETASRRIAKRICSVRREGRIVTTAQLSEVVCRAVGVGDPLSRRSKIHPATRTFQALRMAVNEEIQSLEALLEVAPRLLKPGGRIGVIAFHSGEDRPVKMDFRRRKKEKIYGVLTAKPVVAGAEERQSNPRSRSAKFRVAVRLTVDERGPDGLD